VNLLLHRLPLWFALAGSACACPAHPTTTTVGSVGSTRTSSDVALCGLLDGRFAEWHGLSPFDAATNSPCLGARLESGTRVLGRVPRRFHRNRGASGEAWLFEEDAAVVLVDLFPSARLTQPQAVAMLGPAPWEREVGFGEVLEDAAHPPMVRYGREAVYAARGLALLYGITEDGTLSLHRVRAFVPTDEATYYRRFVREDSVLWQGP
jgi:hypothetical protein